MEDEVEYEIVNEPTRFDKIAVTTLGLIATVVTTALVEELYTRFVINRRTQVEDDDAEA